MGIASHKEMPLRVVNARGAAFGDSPLPRDTLMRRPTKLTAAISTVVAKRGPEELLDTHDHRIRTK